MNNIAIRKQVRIFITPDKHAWWILKITGKGITGTKQKNKVTSDTIFFNSLK